MPDGEADGCIFILASPTVLGRINAGERTVTRMVAIESLVRVQEIYLCEKSRVYITVPKI
jgi:hypothetical protein